MIQVRVPNRRVTAIPFLGNTITLHVLSTINVNPKLLCAVKASTVVKSCRLQDDVNYSFRIPPSEVWDGVVFSMVLTSSKHGASNILP
jgi:hypothetical protein